MRLADQLIWRMTHRAPDFVIGGIDRPYLRRWWVIPRNRFLNVYLHEFLHSDDDRARHTHPWLWNVSVLLHGAYREWFGDGPGDYVDRVSPAFKFRWGAAPHRIELPHGPVWTLFITGPRIREWHFLCPHGLVHWRDFTAPTDKGSIGKGCE